MRSIQVQPLTIENFHEYGDFYDVLNPSGHNLGDFYHDHLLFPVSGGNTVGFSALVSDKLPELIVTAVEYHNYASELILPLDGDVVIHVAPPSKIPVPELTEAFYVPKGTVVKLNIGVWHMAPFAVDNEKTHLLIGLAERTYKNDCIVVEYAQDEQIKIIL